MSGHGRSTVWPAANLFVAAWFPSNERGKANALVQGGAQLGSGIAPPLVAFIIYTSGWHAVFYVSAIMGLLIAIVWYHFARARYASVTSEERAHIEAGVPVRIEGVMPPVPWAKIFSSKNVWGTALAYVGFGYAATIFSTWFFIYLKDGRGFDLKSSAILGTLPFIATTSCCLLGGAISDGLAKRYSYYLGRSLFGAFTLLLGGVVLIVKRPCPRTTWRRRCCWRPGPAPSIWASGLLCSGSRPGWTLYGRDFRPGQHVRPDRRRGDRTSPLSPRNMAGALPSRSRRA